jgi:hypothetical protein
VDTGEEVIVPPLPKESTIIESDGGAEDGKTPEADTGEPGVPAEGEKAVLKDGRQIDFVSDTTGEQWGLRTYSTTDKSSVVGFIVSDAVAADPNTLAYLEAIVGQYNPTLSKEKGGGAADASEEAYYGRLFNWPTDVVVKPCLGVLMPHIPQRFIFASGNVKGEMKTGNRFSNPKARKLLPKEDRGSLLTHLLLCHRLARAIQKFHQVGLAHADLSPERVLLDPSLGQCMVCVRNEPVVPGLRPPDLLGTPGYAAPEVIASQHLPLDDPKRILPNERADSHSLAVHVYEYIFHRHPLRGKKTQGKMSPENEVIYLGEKALFIEDPNDSSNRPAGLAVSYDCLGAELAELFERAFVAGLHDPAARPTAGEWAAGLFRATDLLIPCANRDCDEKWFVYRGLRKPKCPYCGTELKARMPVLELHYKGDEDEYRPENHSVVCWHGRSLYGWHVNRKILPIPGPSPRRRAFVISQEDRWVLVNERLDSLKSASGNVVPKRQATLLTDGDKIVLSEEEGGRLALVKTIP